MECDKCGAEMSEDARACPQCGEPAAAAADPQGDPPDEDTGAPEGTEGAEPEQPSEEAPPSTEPERTFEGTPASAEASGREAGGRSTKAIIAAIAVVVVVVVGLAGYFVWRGMQPTSTPQGAATAMLNAYARYDAKGILDVSTHSALKPAQVTEFEKQAAEAKKRAGGKPGVKDIKIGKVSQTGGTAEVKFSAKWLTDPAKGTYESRDETLTVVQQSGKWLVQLF